LVSGRIRHMYRRRSSGWRTARWSVTFGRGYRNSLEKFDAAAVNDRVWGRSKLTVINFVTRNGRNKALDLERTPFAEDSTNAKA